MQLSKLMCGVFLLAAGMAGSAYAQSAKDFSAGITGLGSQGAPAADPARQNWEESNKAAQAAAEAGLKHVPANPTGPVTAPAPATSGYTLGGGDKVRMTVFGEEDLTGEFDVDGTGVLALPLIGHVNVMGKTLREAEDLVAAQYAKGYLVNPRVALEVLNFRPFFILGEVNKPGSYPYVNNLTVINAVALAGGYTPRASIGKVLIRRADDPKREEVSAPEDAKVFPGDAIRVDERFF